MTQSPSKPRSPCDRRLPPQIRRMQLKICIVGDREVEKTSLIQRYVFDSFSDAYHGTLGTKMHLLQFVKGVAAKETVEADVGLFDIMGSTVRGTRDSHLMRKVSV
jgi:GTPase SAR1 family protein